MGAIAPLQYFLTIPTVGGESKMSLFFSGVFD
jgi:hypothetical protein